MTTAQSDDIFPDSRELLQRILGKYRLVQDAGQIAGASPCFTEC